MGKENLEVKVRWCESGLTSEPFRIVADPEDTEALVRHLESLAIRWRNLPAANYWLEEYELHVSSLDKPWKDEFIVPGMPEQ